MISNMKNMKKVIYLFLLASIVVFNSCKEPERIAGFEDAEQFSIYDYLDEHKEKFSDFIRILESGGIEIGRASCRERV